VNTLAVSKEKKEQTLAGYAELLGKSNAIIITKYGGMSMPQLDKVRKQVRAAEGEFHITKNTLIKKALAERGMNVPDEWLTTSTAMSFCFKDPSAVAKAVGDLNKEFEVFKPVGGLVSGHAIDSKGVKELASLPPIETLRAQIIGVLQAPASGIVGAINAAIGGVAYALQAKVGKEQPAAA